ncbi:MAG: ATP-binding protein [Candidatus Microsaccharimonas sp.]
MNLTESHILVQALSATNSPVTITDNRKPDNPIIYCNDAFIELSGYSKDEIIGKNCRFLQGEATDKKSIKKIKDSVASESESKTTIRNYRKDGTMFWNDLNISPVYNDQGVVTHFIGLQNDVTERIEQERARAEALKIKAEKESLEKEKETLLQLNEAKEDFIAIASHQLRTPATAVKQYLGMLLEDMVGELTDAQKSIAAKAYASNDHQLTIINDLLRIARIDAGQVILNKSLVNINTLIHEVANQFANQLTEQSLVLHLHLPKQDVMLGIDKDLMQTVLENLIDNSVKYSKQNGKIDITLLKKAKTVVIRILDNGIGISLDDQAKLFQKFTRSDSKLAANIGGTGLGLYWVKSVLDMHGATIHVDSEYDKGTLMEVVIPVSI